MKELNLLGAGPSWVECPFRAPETWGVLKCLSIDGLKDKSFDKLFVFDSLTPALNKALAYATIRDIPIVSTLEYATEKYPLADIGLYFGTSYFNPSMSFMIAYALYLGYEFLHIYGIDQGPSFDHVNGKPHILHWLGVASGMKVKYKLGASSMKWAYKMNCDKRLHLEIDTDIKALV